MKIVVNNLVNLNEDAPVEMFEVTLSTEQVLRALNERDSYALVSLLEDIVLQEVANKYKTSLIDFSMEVVGNEGFNLYYPPVDG